MVSSICQLGAMGVQGRAATEYENAPGDSLPAAARGARGWLSCALASRPATPKPPTQSRRGVVFMAAAQQARDSSPRACRPRAAWPSFTATAGVSEGGGFGSSRRSVSKAEPKPWPYGAVVEGGFSLAGGLGACPLALGAVASVFGVVGAGGAASSPSSLTSCSGARPVTTVHLSG